MKSWEIIADRLSKRGWGARTEQPSAPQLEKRYATGGFGRKHAEIISSSGCSLHR
jgi:hypothetical protein